MYRKDFKKFAAAFNEEISQLLTMDDLHSVIQSDGELQEQEIGLSLAGILESAGPWGQHFPEPVFDGRFEIVQRRIVGERHLKLVLRHVEGQRLIDAIAFNIVKADSGELDWPGSVRFADIAYKLSINEYRGQYSAQLIVEHIEPTPVHQAIIS